MLSSSFNKEREREREREIERRGVPCMISLLDQGGQVNLIFSETEDMGCRKPFHIWNSFFLYKLYNKIHKFIFFYRLYMYII